MLNGIKFIHLRHIDYGSVSEKGGATIAFKENEDGSVSYTVARCNSKDNFCRRVGREVSMGRLLKNKDVAILTKEQMVEWDSTYDAILQSRK